MKKNLQIQIFDDATQAEKPQQQPPAKKEEEKKLSQSPVKTRTRPQNHPLTLNQLPSTTNKYYIQQQQQQSKDQQSQQAKQPEIAIKTGYKMENNTEIFYTEDADVDFDLLNEQ